MRVVVGVLLGLFLFPSVAASAADLKIKVVDPQSAAVAGAQVSLIGRSEGRILNTQNTSAEGVATFRMPGTGAYQIQVLAPGFAAETVEVSSQTEINVSLRLATASETVVVSGTRTPVPGEDAGADVDSLNGGQLTAMQPLAASDAIRVSSGRDYQHCRATRRADLPVRARRRIAVQQGDCGWRHHQRAGWDV